MRVSRSVCRVVLPLKPGEDKPGTGSGFLIDGNILITNHHVLPRRGDGALHMSSSITRRTSWVRN